MNFTFCQAAFKTSYVGMFLFMSILLETSSVFLKILTVSLRCLYIYDLARLQQNFTQVAYIRVVGLITMQIPRVSLL